MDHRRADRSRIRRRGQATRQSLAGGGRNNFCNRCKSRKGVQLENLETVRDELGVDTELMTTLAKAVARAIRVT
ncbi:poly-gamma-glutamate hydrolase family protein [Rhizobium leguminosarum]|uniref:poly-gamma-glutamate hydrolase family protein n=1 Tax=Rhizobium leguminosarum TaxID=384 RepID=UPI0039656D6D